MSGWFPTDEQRKYLTGFLAEWLSHGQDDGNHEVWDGCSFDEADAAAPALANELLVVIRGFVTQWEDAVLWECPSCGFAMHSDHKDIEGDTYTCPLCENEGIQRERDDAVAAIRKLRAALKLAPAYMSSIDARNAAVHALADTKRWEES